MSENPNRRAFLKRAAAATSAGTALGFGFEEKALLAKATEDTKRPVRQSSPTGLPMGAIGGVKISRLICGGNIISGFAHSRDLIYVSPLVKRYHTDDKVMETLKLCEENGVNTAILRFDDHVVGILDTYWGERGGTIQWIAQIKQTDERALIRDTEAAIDKGAIGAYVQGGVADEFTRNGRVDIIGKAVECMKKHGVIAGVGAHALEVPVACEKAGLDPDFYMKTLNSKSYWSAGPKERHDSVWAETPQETIKFMKGVSKPWIAFKVLGAGAIHPKEGFKYAFDNGADFVCAGMFDFQVSEDALIAKNLLSEGVERQRPWRA